MTEKLLKAKHWQLFLIIFGIPMVFQFIMMGSMFASISKTNTPDSMLVFSYMKFILILMILLLGGLFAWFWSVAIGLQSKLPSEVKMKVKKFKIFFFTPIIYILLFIGFFMISITGVGLNPFIFLIILPLHLFSMFCMFYILYFVAKTFKTVELQREVSFSDFAGEFFMIWFYPIGIWIIQPKINQMIEE